MKFDGNRGGGLQNGGDPQCIKNIIIKSLKNLLLWSGSSFRAEIWYVASWQQCLKSLLKACWYCHFYANEGQLKIKNRDNFRVTWLICIFLKLQNMVFELCPYTKFEVKRTNGVEMAGPQSGGRIIKIIKNRTISRGFRETVSRNPNKKQNNFKRVSRDCLSKP